MHQLERQGADIQSKVEKMKDDAIAHLSDQLVAITASLQEVERRQQVSHALLFHASISIK